MALFLMWRAEERPYQTHEGHQENPHFTFHAFLVLFLLFYKKAQKKSQVLGFPSDLAFCAFLVLFFLHFHKNLQKRRKSRKSKIWVFLMDIIHTCH